MNINRMSVSDIRILVKKNLDGIYTININSQEQRCFDNKLAVWNIVHAELEGIDYNVTTVYINDIMMPNLEKVIQLFRYVI